MASCASASRSQPFPSAYNVVIRLLHNFEIQPRAFAVQELRSGAGDRQAQYLNCEAPWRWAHGRMCYRDIDEDGASFFLLRVGRGGSVAFRGIGMALAYI